MGTMDFNRMSRFLVLLILIANVADFCQGKAFSEADKIRGKRYYNDQSAGLHQTYDSQSNAEHWMKGKFYEPEVDGQPIYVPPADMQGGYNEFLDAYYKAYTPAWSMETPGPPIYDTKNIYKKPEESVVKLPYNKDKVKYAIPKESQLTVEMSTSEDYDDPEIVDKTAVIELSNEDSGIATPESDENQLTVEMSQSDDYSDPKSEDYDAPDIVDKIVDTEIGNKKSDIEEFKDLEVTQLSKAKPKDYSQYDQPVIKSVKQKQKASMKGAQKKTSVYKTNPPLSTEDYEKPVVHKTIKSKPKSTPVPKYSDQISPSQATRKTSKGKRRKQNSKSKKPITGDYTVDLQSTLDPKTVYGTPYEQSKNDDLYAQDVPTKVKEKVVVKTDQKGKPVKTTQKIVVKTDSQNKHVKTKEKVVVKSDSISKPIKTRPNKKPVKTKENVVVKTDPQYQPDNSKEKVITKPGFNEKPLKEKSTIKYNTKEPEKYLLTRQLNDETDSVGIDIMKNTDNPLEDEFDQIEKESSENINSDAPTGVESNLNSETSKSEAPEKKDSIFPNPNDFRGLSSMNSNIWSMLFNPQAEQNRLKQKRCITRSNETGFCTYIQNCEVPHIATSLDQLLNNACVIDDIFIGVCCPEFPVQTVKVHWDQTPSDFDSQIEDEFGNNFEDCGIRSNEASELQSWPWKAPLVSMSNGKIFCGGVVVSQDHVLTAAHCTTKIPKNQILVRLGQFDDGSGDDYAVTEIKRHAQYNPRTMQNDVALLKLGRRIMNGAHIGIVCLPDEDGKNDHDGETATLLGWRGIFGTKSRDPEFLEVISNRECENKLGMKVPNTLLCTETRKESERTCNADSGAPLVIEEDGKYEVIGILSWNRNDCNQRFPSTFSRVSVYTGWIKNHIA